MKMQIGRWGNSLAVRLPKSLVERFRLKEGDEIDLEAMATALASASTEEMQQRRENALRDIANTRWTLPADWKFDRDELHERGSR
jgi:antitoxin MazE